MEVNKLVFLDIVNGQLADLSGSQHPLKIFGWNSTLNLKSPNSTFFGFVFDGKSKINNEIIHSELPAGSYFSFSEQINIEGGSGFVIEMMNYKGLPMIGGPIEDKGRLLYIDGCTDTLLISPPQYGDPCLNLLYFPPKVNQTHHTHPSIRVGIVVKGKGVCHSEHGDFALISGKIFYMLENTTHGFQTEDSEMIVVAWHPDSDMGPTNDNHPMVNRTVVGGVSANKIDVIRTKDEK